VPSGMSTIERTTAVPRRLLWIDRRVLVLPGVASDCPSGRIALPKPRKNSTHDASAVVATSALCACVASASSAKRGRRKCLQERISYVHTPHSFSTCHCATNGDREADLMNPRSRWAGAGVGIVERNDVPQLPAERTVVLQLDTPAKDVIEALLMSHSVCIENEKGRSIYVKVIDGTVVNSSEALKSSSTDGYACIQLADLLDAPRELPLSCLIGEDESEECAGYGNLPDPYNESGPVFELTSRLPWLVVLLAFLTVSSAILEYYDALLQRHLVIAFYLTALVGCGGNSGSQAAALVMQGMATGELAPTARDVGTVLGKELIIALGIAAVLCTGISMRILLFGGSPADALLIAVAMALTVVFSVVFGAVSPLLLQRAGLEPAKISGPLLSTAIDIVGVLVACLSASLLEAVWPLH